MAPVPAVQPREFVRAKVAWRKTRQRTGAAALAGGVQIRGATAFRLGARGLRRQTACKPGSVPARGRRWPFICDARHEAPGATDPDDCAETRLPVPPSRKWPTCRPYLVLLPVGFTLPSPLPATRCALTAPFHPCRRAKSPAGGLLSVALSLGSPPPGVTRHRVSVEPGLSSPACSIGEGGHPAVWPP